MCYPSDPAPGWEHVHGPVFTLPARKEPVNAFRLDLAAACTAWLESHGNAAERSEAVQSSFSTTIDERGRFVDFHALRHTFISNLAAAGVHPKTFQRLARHSSNTPTMDRYTHLLAGDSTEAMNALPDLSTPVKESAKATGTFDSVTIPDLSLRLSPQRDIQCVPVNAGEQNAVGGGVVETNGNPPEKAALTDISGGISSARATGLEPATTGSTVRYSIQLSYAPESPGRSIYFNVEFCQGSESNADASQHFNRG